jgi:hypothetical protein
MQRSFHRRGDAPFIAGALACSTISGSQLTVPHDDCFTLTRKLIAGAWKWDRAS